MQHLKYHDRVAIEFEVSENPDSTLRSVADRLGVSRSTVMREIIRNSTVTKPKGIVLKGTPKEPAPLCPTLRKWPFCCNRCARTNCQRTRLHYRAGEAERASKATNAKAARKPSKETLRRAAEVEGKVAPMIKSPASPSRSLCPCRNPYATELPYMASRQGALKPYALKKRRIARG